MGDSGNPAFLVYQTLQYTLLYRKIAPARSRYDNQNRRLSLGSSGSVTQISLLQVYTQNSRKKSRKKG